jgi:SAM-dependent methyltransferase
LDTTFDHCGLAALTDLRSEIWRGLWDELLREQERFLAREADFRSPAYAWPRDALRNWSRVWEYPFAYHHVRKEQRLSGRALRILDVGSGVAFFPFATARLGNEVICVDVDPICVRDMKQAIEVVDAAPGRVGVRQSGGRDVPVPDGWADMIVCISVLEHVADRVALVEAMAAALRPNGLCLLSMDLDLRGDFELGPVEYRRVHDALALHFDPAFPTRTVHPAEMLRSTNGPYGFSLPPAWPLWRFRAKQWLRGAIGRSRRPLYPFELAVEGLVLRKPARTAAVVDPAQPA